MTSDAIFQVNGDRLLEAAITSNPGESFYFPSRSTQRDFDFIKNSIHPQRLIQPEKPFPLNEGKTLIPIPVTHAFSSSTTRTRDYIPRSNASGVKPQFTNLPSGTFVTKPSKETETWPETTPESLLSTESDYTISSTASTTGITQTITSTPKIPHHQQKQLFSDTSDEQRSSVLAKYIERFRHGEPTHRERRTRPVSNNEQEFWWLHTPSNYQSSESYVKPSFMSEQRHDTSQTPKHIVSLESTPTEADLIDNLISDTNSLLRRTEVSIQSTSSTEPAVSTDGLGSSSSATTFDEPVRKPIEFDFKPTAPKAKPEDDILYQWRLRRKIEQAQTEKKNPLPPTSLSAHQVIRLLRPSQSGTDRTICSSAPPPSKGYQPLSVLVNCQDADVQTETPIHAIAPNFQSSAVQTDAGFLNHNESSNTNTISQSKPLPHWPSPASAALEKPQPFGSESLVQIQVHTPELKKSQVAQCSETSAETTGSENEQHLETKSLVKSNSDAHADSSDGDHNAGHRDLRQSANFTENQNQRPMAYSVNSKKSTASAAVPLSDVIDQAVSDYLNSTSADVSTDSVIPVPAAVNQHPKKDPLARAETDDCLPLSDMVEDEVLQFLLRKRQLCLRKLQIIDKKLSRLESKS